jgi:hypothetical protein
LKFKSRITKTKRKGKKMAKKEFKINEVPGHIKRSAKEYFFTYKNTWYLRAKNLLSDIDSIVEIEADLIKVDEVNLERAEVNMQSLTGYERKIVSNFVTSTYNLMNKPADKGGYNYTGKKISII